MSAAIRRQLGWDLIPQVPDGRAQYAPIICPACGKQSPPGYHIHTCTPKEPQ
jgi:hypothetical protein